MSEGVLNWLREGEPEKEADLRGDEDERQESNAGSVGDSASALLAELLNGSEYWVVRICAVFVANQGCEWGGKGSRMCLPLV